jgi:hypothetical protein
VRRISVKSPVAATESLWSFALPSIEQAAETARTRIAQGKTYLGNGALSASQKFARKLHARARADHQWRFAEQEREAANEMTPRHRRCGGNLGNQAACWQWFSKTPVCQREATVSPRVDDRHSFAVSGIQIE